jgi:hypothetical protein
MLNSYSVLDYLPRLTSADSEYENNFTMLVNLTAHVESFFEVPDYTPSLTVTNFGTGPFRKEDTYHCNAAAIKRIGDWLNFLKSEGVYNNSRIIIVSDHGVKKNFVSKMSFTFPVNVDNFNPILLYKDFDTSGVIKKDMMFMTNAEVPTLALDGLIENPVNPYTGNKLSTEAKAKPLYIAVSAGSDTGGRQAFEPKLNPKEDWYVSDNIFDSNNWSRAQK